MKQETNGPVSATLPLVALAAGIVARIVLFPLHPNLWEDEIIATTHSVQPLGRLLVNVARNDIHPPLYFIQLHIWGLVSHADAWFVANSVFWSFAALISLWSVVYRKFSDERLAWAATGIMAVLPTSLEMAFSVRMYAMLSAMVIWAYYFADLAFSANRRPKRWPLFVMNALLIYTHAIGFLAVLFNSFYALTLLRRRQASRRDYLIWLALYGGAAAIALPVLATDALHDANLEGIAGPGTLLAWLATSVVGSNPAGGFAWIAAGVVLFAGIAGFGFANTRTRPVAASYVIAPLFFAIIVGLAIKPIFKADFFSAIMSPFVALVLARLLLDVPGTAALRYGGYAASALALAVMGVSAASVDVKSTNFGAAAAVIRANSQAGDVVYAPQPSMFWGMAWNLAGPDWGSPLAIAPEPSPQWRGVYRRLGPGIVKTMGLWPSTQELPAGQVTLLVGKDSLTIARRARRLWLISYPRADLPAEALDKTQGDLGQIAIWRFGYNKSLSLALYALKGDSGSPAQ